MAAAAVERISSVIGRHAHKTQDKTFFIRTREGRRDASISKSSTFHGRVNSSLEQDESGRWDNAAPPPRSTTNAEEEMRNEMADDLAPSLDKGTLARCRSFLQPVGLSVRLPVCRFGGLSVSCFLRSFARSYVLPTCIYLVCLRVI